MLDVWNPADDELVPRIAAFQREHCCEEIDESRTNADQCEFCPYPGYRFVRLTYSAQRIRVSPPGSAGRRYEVTEGAISYLLVKAEEEEGLLDVIPLHPNSENLYAINRRLRLRLTLDSVAQYLVFYGMVIAGDEGSFYFIINTNHISTIRESLSEDARSTLDGMIHASFKLSETGDLSLRIRERSYPIFGRSFTLAVPTVYAGDAYTADVRLSETGMPTMDEDEPTTIRGLDDALLIARRYPLEFSADVEAAVAKTKRKLNSKIRLISVAFTLERVLSVLLLPAYFLSLAVVFYAGFTNVAVHGYYNELKSLALLSWANVFLGALLAVGVTIRFVVTEVAALSQKMVPGQLSYFFDAMTRTLKTQRAQLGMVPLMLGTAFEFLAGAFLAMNLFIYGVSNSFDLSMTSPDLNFIEAFLLIVLSVPIVGPSLDWVLEIGDAVGLYQVYRDNILMYASSFVISTITFGWLIRVFRIIRSDD